MSAIFGDDFPECNWKVGDLCQVNPRYARTAYLGVVFVVKAVPGGARKKLLVEPLRGDGGLTGLPHVFVGPTHPEWEGSVPSAEEIAKLRESVEDEVSIVAGTVVELHARSGFYVVIGSTGDKWRAVLLGGDGGRYVAGITRTSIKRVYALGEGQFVV